MQYTVYQHESNTSHKKYIGYTSKGMMARLHKHYVNAMANVDTHFYNAIRRYGLDDFTSTILWEGDNETLALEQEMYYIDMYNTFKEGYNQTLGGTGGWCVPPEKYEAWKLKVAHPKETNGRWCGHSDNDILECAHDYFSKNPMSMAEFLRYSSKEFNMPKSYSKNRFGVKGFKQMYCEKYNLDLSYFTYKKTDIHKQNLSVTNTSLSRHWYSNHKDNISKQFTENNQPSGWVLGRYYGNKNRKIS